MPVLWNDAVALAAALTQTFASYEVRYINNNIILKFIGISLVSFKTKEAAFNLLPIG